MILKARVAQLAIMYFAVNGTARARRMRFCAFFVQIFSWKISIVPRTFYTETFVNCSKKLLHGDLR